MITLLKAFITGKIIGWILRGFGKILFAPLDLFNWLSNGHKFDTSEKAVSVVGMFIRVLLCPFAWLIIFAALFGACQALH